VLLSLATGGAVLGSNTVARVTIAKSDSLSGVARFLNDSRIALVNPNATLTLSLVLERAGGFVGNATVRLKHRSRRLHLHLGHLADASIQSDVHLLKETAIYRCGA